VQAFIFCSYFDCNFKVVIVIIIIMQKALRYLAVLKVFHYKASKMRLLCVFCLNRPCMTVYANCSYGL